MASLMAVSVYHIQDRLKSPWPCDVRSRKERCHQALSNQLCRAPRPYGARLLASMFWNDVFLQLRPACPCQSLQWWYCLRTPACGRGSPACPAAIRVKYTYQRPGLEKSPSFPTRQSSQESSRVACPPATPSMRGLIAVDAPPAEEDGVRDLLVAAFDVRLPVEGGVNLVSRRTPWRGLGH